VPLVLLLLLLGSKSGPSFALSFCFPGQTVSGMFVNLIKHTRTRCFVSVATPRHFSASTTVRSAQPNIIGMNEEEILQLAQTLGMEKWRVTQIWVWLYNKGTIPDTVYCFVLKFNKVLKVLTRCPTCLGRREHG
jgi:hypothetical protein